MKVAFLLRKFPALSETFILDQIVGLIERGIEVDIYSLFKGEDDDVHPLLIKYNLLNRTHFPKYPCPENLFLRAIQSFRLFTPYQLVDFKKQIKCLNFYKYRRQAILLHLLFFSTAFEKKMSYDIIHCHFGMYGLVGIDLRTLGFFQGKVVTSFHGMDIHVYPKQNGLSVYRRLFKKGDLFTVNSDFTKRCLMNLGCPENKISKLPVGLRIREYHPKAKTSEYNHQDQIQILTVARLTEKKGLDYSVAAVAKLHRNFPNIQYKIVGQGDRFEHLTQLIKNLRATDYIHLLGSRNQVELRNLYYFSDIFVLASITASNGDMEGQGLVLQEAQASGLPVVSTLHNGIPEGVINNHSGFLVPEKDVDAIAEKLKILILSPSQRFFMGLNGREYVRKTFDLNLLNSKLLKLYQGLL
jgi:colanic acid/amylovoran biosynthesis glycosyltransferase